jgi:hypothetical protein
MQDVTLDVGRSSNGRSNEHRNCGEGGEMHLRETVEMTRHLPSQPSRRT